MTNISCICRTKTKIIITNFFANFYGSVHGDQALIRGAKIIALMGLELIENKKLFDEVVEQHSQIKG
jgi:hypothetical protein